MKKLSMFFVLAVALLTAPAAMAAGKVNVLVIDSGSDFEHKVLKPLGNANKQELNGKAGVDDDKNGYIDDVYGWNFVEKNNILVNLKDTPPDYDTILKCMEYINKLQAYGQEAFTKEEWAWLVKHYNDPKISPWINFVGGWAHGTHCAGIIAKNNTAVSLNAIRHIPTGSAPHGAIKDALVAIRNILLQRFARKRVTMEMLEKSFEELGKKQVAEIQEEASYIGSLNPRLINCSFGSDNAQVFQMIKSNMKYWGFTNPTDEKVQEIVNLFVTKAFLPRDKAMFAKAKDALVFIAAGNSSENLDAFVTSPNNVQIPNKIVVAATDEDQKLAEFSCYGKKTVDVAVPGVNIYATYPNQKMGYMSGTSMACPNAVRYASLVLEVNPKLTAVELKNILMKTVDKKEWLKDKVKSGGVINVNRAMEAARQVKAGKNVNDACKLARTKVSDNVSRPKRNTKPNLKDPFIKKVYFSNVF
jgi:subtilisin family serine protease